MIKAHFFFLMSDWANHNRLSPALKLANNCRAAMLNTENQLVETGYYFLLFSQPLICKPFVNVNCVFTHCACVKKPFANGGHQGRK